MLTGLFGFQALQHLFALGMRLAFWMQTLMLVISILENFNAGHFDIGRGGRACVMESEAAIPDVCVRSSEEPCSPSAHWLVGLFYSKESV